MFDEFDFFVLSESLLRLENFENEFSDASQTTIRHLVFFWPAI